MLVDAKSYMSVQTLDADICIMGGGVAGITLANELKLHFPNILLIESGDEHYTQESQELYAPSKKPSVYPDPSYSRLRFLGGTSNHWLNNTSPLSATDFEKRDWLENSGWPISYEDLVPHYNRAAYYCGIQDNNYDREYWQKTLNQDNPFVDSKAIEFSIAKVSSPPVRFYAEHGASLVESSSVTVLKNANVTDLIYDEQSSKVSSITFNAYSKLNHSINARIFIMCFGGIENARMLLHFNRKYNNQLGNQADNVGRYFMDHPTMKAAQLFTKDQDIFKNNSVPVDDYNVVRFMQLTEDATNKNRTINLRMPAIPANNYQLSDGISSFHVLKKAMSSGKLPDNAGRHIGNLFSDLDMVVEAISRKSFDTYLFDDAKDFGGYELHIMLEQAPHRDNRIRLGKEIDTFGIPKVEIDWELKNSDKERLWTSLEVLAREVGALSIGRVRLLKEQSTRLFGDQMGFGHHHMGATRMAESEENGVVNKDLKVFGTSNLFISGCSVFTTGGNVPPTLTITALSIRLAHHIIRLHHD